MGGNKLTDSALRPNTCVRVDNLRFNLSSNTNYKSIERLTCKSLIDSVISGPLLPSLPLVVAFCE